jgi:FtsP/CotA-like multicopper oxidase with cupredoxin domain
MHVVSEPSFTFSIDNHLLTIIEADGIPTMPRVVDSIQIFAGQRYSFVLEANQPVGNYCTCIAHASTRGMSKQAHSRFIPKQGSVQIPVGVHRDLTAASTVPSSATKAHPRLNRVRKQLSPHPRCLSVRQTSIRSPQVLCRAARAPTAPTCS